jgi:hypothetical protein
MDSEKLISIPKRFIVYCNADPDVIDPYTVVYPDGAVFLFDNNTPHGSRYLCSFNNFSKDGEDELIEFIPESLLEAIIIQES